MRKNVSISQWKFPRDRTRSAAPLARPQAAFTIVELLVVIAILAMLISLSAPALKQARIVARDTLCITNLKTHGTALTSYAADNSAYYPVFGSMTDELLRDIPSVTNPVMYRPVAPYQDGWDAAKGLPNTPLYRGRYLDQYAAKKLQCPSGSGPYVNGAVTPVVGIENNITPVWGYPRYTYCYLAGIPHEGFRKDPRGVEAGGEVNTFYKRNSGAALILRYNTMVGVDRRAIPRPTGGAAFNPFRVSTTALMTDVTVWDNSPYDWPGGKHYWVNHSKSGYFFPNPMTAAGADQSHDTATVGYQNLVDVCRLSNTVWADGHVSTRRPEQWPAGFTDHFARTHDNGEKMPMISNYGTNTYPGWYFYRYYW